MELFIYTGEDNLTIIEQEEVFNPKTILDINKRRIAMEDGETQELVPELDLCFSNIDNIREEDF